PPRRRRAGSVHHASATVWAVDGAAFGFATVEQSGGGRAVGWGGELCVAGARQDARRCTKPLVRGPGTDRGRCRGIIEAEPLVEESAVRVAESLRGDIVRRELSTAPFLVAARGGTPSRLPVWFMRQAGRSLPEYRRVRGSVPMLTACFDPGMITEITLQPVRRHGVDAAILFSDIVVPLKAAGIGVDIKPGIGPVVDHPVRDRAG